jgi:hypothetical protein
MVISRSTMFPSRMRPALTEKHVSVDLIEAVVGADPAHVTGDARRIFQRPGAADRHREAFRLKPRPGEGPAIDKETVAPGTNKSTPMSEGGPPSFTLFLAIGRQTKIATRGPNRLRMASMPRYRFFTQKLVTQNLSYRSLSHRTCPTDSSHRLALPSLHRTTNVEVVTQASSAG